MARSLRRRGYDVTRRKGQSHWTITDGGARVATMSGSPSDWRAMRKVRADVARYERGAVAA
jgi:hypothetical protein